MALQSMTGFARAEGTSDNFSWVWELRSVNGKGLDARLRLPSGFEAIEAEARSVVANLFKRGNIQLSLQINGQLTDSLPKVNVPALEAMMEAAKTVQAKVGGHLPSPADFLGMRGVVETHDVDVDADEEARNARNRLVLQSLQEAANALQQMRIVEGQAIKPVLEKQISQIESQLESITNNEARKPSAIKAQLSEQVQKLVQASETLDPQRLHQEAIVLAAKADLQEELDRLAVHVISARDLLSGEGPVGRKLDFLAQEFNRECNTICSKSNSADVTSQALDMKLVIDQFREQLQNME